jgi:hypothetical protein
MPSLHRGFGTQRPQVLQFNLFDHQHVGPQWRHLPPATRLAVSDLMVRLLSEHRSERPDPTGERRND